MSDPHSTMSVEIVITPSATSSLAPGPAQSALGRRCQQQEFNDQDEPLRGAATIKAIRLPPGEFKRSDWPMTKSDCAP